MSAALKILPGVEPPDTVITERKQCAGLVPFKPGQSGNPKGRPKGSRNKLGEEFVSDLHDIWREKGRETLLHVCEKHPVEFIKIVASIVPRTAGMEVAPQNPFDGMSDEELDQSIQLLMGIIRREKTEA